MISDDKKGYFGNYGGALVDQSLKEVLTQVEYNFYNLVNDQGFIDELDFYQREYIGRPSPLYFAKNLTKYLGGAKIYLKREDLNHTGSHKINNAMGQVLLAKKMGKSRIIAETGAGQHGVATATACAVFGLDCTVYMGDKDVKRQQLNVFRMELLGAKVVAVTKGSQTLKEAVDEALDDYVKNAKNTYYMLGSAVGPHPYPIMVRTFQSIIGRETKKQIQALENKLPDFLIACVGGGSNAIGLFHPFYMDKNVKMIGVEPAGKGLDTNEHSASISRGTPGTIHGFRCYLVNEEINDSKLCKSIAAGLDYPGIGPEHCFYNDSGRATYVGVTDKEALDGFKTLAKIEGIIPALESAHAVAHAIKIATTLDKDKIIVINISGRGDKDVAQIKEMLRPGQA